MAVTVHQKNQLQRTTGNGAGAELRYIIKGTSDEAAASNALMNTAPGSYSGWSRQSCRVEWLAPGVWEGTATYQAEESQPTDSYSFDTGGGTVHITQSKGTVRSVAASGTAPDCKGAIGSTRSAVEGCDITVPVFHFSETHTKTAAQVSDAYKGTLYSLTGRTNSGSFKGCNAGECLFLGASGSRRGSGDWEITYKFAASPNTTINIPGIGNVDKGGWEYLWIRYMDEYHEASESMVKVPQAAYVERVYDSGNFGLLGI